MNEKEEQDKKTLDLQMNDLINKAKADTTAELTKIETKDKKLYDQKLAEKEL